MAKYIGVIEAPAKFGGACGFVNNPTLEDGSRCDIDLGKNKNGCPKGVFVHHTFLPEGTHLDGTKISYDMEPSSKGGYQAIKETITILEVGPEPSAASVKEKSKSASAKKFEGKAPVNPVKGTPVPKGSDYKSTLTQPSPKPASKPDPVIAEASKAKAVAGSGIIGRMRGFFGG